MEILQSCYNRHGLRNKNWILAGLRNIKTCNFCCFDCASTTIGQTMSEHRFPLQLQYCPALHWYCSHRHNPPVIVIDCVRTLWIVQDCETLRNRDCGGLPHNLVDCHVISPDQMPTIDSAIQKIASQSTKSGRNRNSGYIGKREDCGVFGDAILVIFSIKKSQSLFCSQVSHLEVFKYNQFVIVESLRNSTRCKGLCVL